VGCFQNGAFSIAAPLLEGAIKKDPDNSTYRYHLGLTYNKLSDPKKARIELEKSIQHAKKLPKPWPNSQGVERYLALGGNYEDA
jgi:Tfp pilus assembly protein PilF